MSQNKLPTIVPTVDTGTTLSNALNIWADAIETSQSGATAPAAPAAGNVWFDTTTNRYKIYDGAAWAVISFQGDAVVTSATPPASPTAGSTWFDTSTGNNVLKVYNGINWAALASVDDTVFTGTTPPTAPTAGKLWFDTSTGNNVLKVWDGTNWDELAMITAAARPLTYIGIKDVTAAIGTYTPSNGDFLIVGADGKGQATWIGLAGIDVKTGDSAVYDGAKWDLMEGVAHTPKPAPEVYPFTAYNSAGGLDITFITQDGSSLDIDWGDGAVAASQTPGAVLSHAYSDAKNYLVKVTSVGIKEIQVDKGSAFRSLNRLPEHIKKFTIRSALSHSTTTGVLSQLPNQLTQFYCDGDNQVSGDIAALPVGLDFFRCNGNNTISGDIATLPVGLQTLTIGGANTVSGDIAGLPQALQYLYISGKTTITGDLAQLPATVDFIRLEGDATVKLTGATLKTTTLQNFQLTSSVALTYAEVDKILIALDSDVTNWTGAKTINLTGSNQAPTLASAAAITSLQGKGVTVTTN